MSTNDHDDGKRIIVNSGLLDTLWQLPREASPATKASPEESPVSAEEEAPAAVAPEAPPAPAPGEGRASRERPSEIPPSQWHQAGESNFRQGRYRDAAGCFLRVANAEPRRWQPRFNLALCRARLGRWEEAASGFEQVSALQPDLWAAHTALGVCLLQCDRPRAALAAFNKALTIAPAEPQSRMGRALALHGMERFEEALAAYEGILRELGETDDLLVNLAAASAAAGRPERAALYAARLPVVSAGRTPGSPSGAA